MTYCKILGFMPPGQHFLRHGPLVRNDTEPSSNLDIDMDKLADMDKRYVSGTSSTKTKFASRKATKG